MRPYNPHGVIAFFISFRCYGTWFHGDDRGSVDRKGHNVYGLPKLPPDPARVAAERRQSHASARLLTPQMRIVIEATIREVCMTRGIVLLAVNAQSDHVHCVVSSGNENPDKLIGSLKSWCTRRLRENGHLGIEDRIWSRHGSTVWLWTELSVENAIRYTLDGQGEPPATYRE